MFRVRLKQLERFQRSVSFIKPASLSLSSLTVHGSSQSERLYLIPPLLRGSPRPSAPLDHGHERLNAGRRCDVTSPVSLFSGLFGGIC